MAMFNLGLPELLIIGVIALLVFGPKRLPDLAKNLGKGIRDFKKALEGDSEEEKKTLSNPGAQIQPPVASASKVEEPDAKKS